MFNRIVYLQLGDYEIAWVDGEVGKTNDMLTLLPLPSAPLPHKSVLIGDLKLADFKQFLASQGVQVFFFQVIIWFADHQWPILFDFS